MNNKIIEKLKQFENKKIAILGFGREGKSTYKLFRKYFPDMHLTILDKADTIKDEEDVKKDQEITIITGENYLNNLEPYDLIIKSPGISLKELNIENIKEKITSQIELFLEVGAQNVIGVTGTKGKSTTSSLIYEILKKQNPNTILAGNIGLPIFDCLEKCNEETKIVMEMSSHQLEFLHVSPHIGIILNLYEDHLDHAGTVENYHACKMNMFKNQTENDIMIYCQDNETLNEKIKKGKWKGQKYSVSLTEESDIYLKEDRVVFADKEIYNTNAKRNLLGMHNLENIMVALLVSELLHLDLEKTIETITNFRPLAYRLENIGTFKEVTYYMSTLSTIPEATINDIKALENVNTLIFGGMDRGISYDKLIQFLKQSTIEHFICMPTTGHKISEHLPKEKVYKVNTLEEAVELAKKITKKNTICLLSPAAASYEQFKNYQEKGDKFKEYVFK